MLSFCGPLVFFTDGVQKHAEIVLAPSSRLEPIRLDDQKIFLHRAPRCVPIQALVLYWG